MKHIKQFEIYQADLGPYQGSEQGGKRPCVLLQTEAVGHIAKTFVVAPCSTKKLNRIYSYQVYVHKSKMNGLKEDSKIKLDQIRVIDRKRLIKKIGILETDYHPSVFQAIDVIIDRFGDFR